MTDIAKLVQSDIDGRIAKGVETYGERLRAFNGRDALQDAYEEALDLCLYLRQAIREREAQRIADSELAERMRQLEAWLPAHIAKQKRWQSRAKSEQHLAAYSGGITVANRVLNFIRSSRSS